MFQNSFPSLVIFQDIVKLYSLYTEHLYNQLVFWFCADYFSEEMKISLGLKKMNACKYNIILYLSALGIVLCLRGVFNIPVKIHRYFLDLLVIQLCEKHVFELYFHMLWWKVTVRYVTTHKHFHWQRLSPLDNKSNSKQYTWLNAIK